MTPRQSIEVVSWAMKIAAATVLVAVLASMLAGCTPELPTSPSRIADALGCPESEVVPAQRTGTAGQWYVCAGSQQMPTPPAPADPVGGRRQ